MQQEETGSPLIGSQTPTHLLEPARVDYSDVEAVLELADIVGIDLDPWQADFLANGLGRMYTEDGGSKWSAYEVAIELSRQNGKSVIFEMRALAGLFVFGEQLIVYSAHKGETAMAAYARMVQLVESSPVLKRRVHSTPAANGKEAIILKHPDNPRKKGAMIKFRTRTAGGGRGLTGDCVIIDEVQDATDDHIAALFPSMAAKSKHGDPQIWYGGSAGNRKSVILGRLVKRCDRELARRRDGDEWRDRRLAMARWAADLDVDDVDSPRTWAKTNPTYGIRITRDFIEQEFLAMGAGLDPTRFAAERLGVGDYPREEGEDWIIPRRRWEAAMDPESTPVGAVVFVVEVRPDRSSTSIVVAGRRADGRKHIEVIAEEVGVTWAIPELQRLTLAHENIGVGIDPAGPAASLIGPLRDAGVEILEVGVNDITTGWGEFFDAFASERPGILHRGGLLLTAAIAAADTREVRGATTWKRSTPDNSSAALGVTWACRLLDKVKPKKSAAVSRRVHAGDPTRPSEQRPRHFNTRLGGGRFDPRTARF